MLINLFAWRAATLSRSGDLRDPYADEDNRQEHIRAQRRALSV